MINKQNSLAALDDLWNSALPSRCRFDPACLDARSVPKTAQHYLTHAIAPGTHLATAVRLRMHGEFRRKNWYPFTAEQVIRADGEMLWCAKLRMNGLSLRGFDRVAGGKGAMEWELLGFLPVVRASGLDVTRSAIGRIQGESVWLPSLLCGGEVTWAAPEPSHAHARLTLLGETTELALAVADTGRLESIQYARWGNPDGGTFRYAPFGGIAEQEARFGGYTIPTRLRIGWHFGTPRFETEGEFFRVTIDDAVFR